MRSFTIVLAASLSIVFFIFMIPMEFVIFAGLMALIVCYGRKLSQRQHEILGREICNTFNSVKRVGDDVRSSYRQAKKEMTQK